MLVTCPWYARHGVRLRAWDKESFKHLWVGNLRKYFSSGSSGMICHDHAPRPRPANGCSLLSPCGTGARWPLCALQWRLSATHPFPWTVTGSQLTKEGRPYFSSSCTSETEEVICYLWEGRRPCQNEATLSAIYLPPFQKCLVLYSFFFSLFFFF